MKTCGTASFGAGSARRVLEGYLSRPRRDERLEIAAYRLLELLDRDPSAAAEAVHGRFSAAVEKLAARPAGSRSLDWGSSPTEAPGPDLGRLSGWDPATRPSEPLVEVQQGPEGGPTVPSSEYPHHAIRYPELNPVQSLLLPWVERDANVVIAAPTSAGKTIAAEMFMGAALARGGKALYLSPLKAVTQEKHDDWSDSTHAWASRRVSIVTGDYSLTDARKAELRRADVILLTTEMLDSRTRRMEAERNYFLAQALILAVDEGHLLTMEGRGDALESGLMRFTRINPRARVILFSATMPNVVDLGRWLTRLNGKPSVVVSSDYRPTKLTVHWDAYPERGGNYAWNEQAKRDAAVALVKRHRGDKFIAFVHSKKMGRDLLRVLKESGEEAEFHNADLGRDDRLRLEKKFRDGKLRVIVATSTLAWGVNMPARRVVVVGVHRGLQEVSPIDVRQECGRAGRLGLDPEGDAHVLLPERRRSELRVAFEKAVPIESTLNEEGVLAFHLIAELVEGVVATEAAAAEWHARSFASLRGSPLPERVEATASEVAFGKPTLSAAKVLEDLSRCGCARRDPSGRYSPTELGRVASWLYFSPFDVADWSSNFRVLVEKNRLRDEAALAWALGCVRSSFRDSWLPRELDLEMGKLEQRVRGQGIDCRRLPPAVLAWFGNLRGEDYPALAGVQRGLHHDASRTFQALRLVDERALRLLGREYLELLEARALYGVDWRGAELCLLPGIGRKRAEILLDRGIANLDSVVSRPDRVRKLLGDRVADAAIRAARSRIRSASIDETLKSE